MTVQPPDAGLHARQRAGHLIRYTLPEITMALEGFAALEEEYQRLVGRAAQLTAPYELPGALSSYPDQLAGLWPLLDSSLCPGLSLGAGSRELYPVATWRRAIRQLRVLTDRLRTWLDRYCAFLAQLRQATIEQILAEVKASSDSARRMQESVG